MATPPGVAAPAARFTCEPGARGYARPMHEARPARRPVLLRLAAALLAAAWLAPATALELGDITIEGVTGALEANVRARLSLAQHPDAEALTEARLGWLLRQAPAEVLKALEPFGYYAPEVQVDPVRQGELVAVRLRITPGEPVRVRTHAITLRGDGAGDSHLTGLRDGFQPAVGDVLEHRVYEASKGAIERTLLGRGYFDAAPGSQRVEVTRATQSARIELDWDTGPRHVFGPTRFVDSHIDEAVLRRRIPWQEGEPFTQERLVELHQALAALDYFALVDIQPRPEQGSGTEAPIEVGLGAAKRSLYTAGISYGTDHGAALELGLERRYVNRRGHKFEADLMLGQTRSLANAVYRIPALSGPVGWWSAGLQLREEDIADFGRTETAELVLARSGEVDGYLFSAEMHVLRQRFNDSASTLVYPQFTVEHSEGDHPLYPRNGFGWSATLRAGHSAIGSDADFAQALASATWIRPLGERQRLLLRGTAGTTWTDEFAELPPALRFYAGGDRSVRGYGYQEIGPRDDEGRVIGGKHLLAASVEFEHMFTDAWGAAVFVDAGDAFSSSEFEARLAAGVGLRWRSPVGPVRVDVGVGLDDPDRAVRLHLTIGPEL